MSVSPWHFAGLIEHWNKKHAKAAYVPYLARNAPVQQYNYGDRVRLGENTNFLKFLNAMAKGIVIYDPGIKLETGTNGRTTVKRRSQFRIRSAELGELY